MISEPQAMQVTQPMAPVADAPVPTVPSPTVPELAPLVPTVLAIPEPPAEVPAEFKSIVRRSFKLLNTLSRSPEQDALLSIYMAFLNAVNSQSPDVEDLGDELGDLYMKYAQK